MRAFALALIALLGVGPACAPQSEPSADSPAAVVIARVLDRDIVEEEREEIRAFLNRK